MSIGAGAAKANYATTANLRTRTALLDYAIELVGPPPHSFIEELPPTGIVYDIGCGYGHWARQVATPTRSVIGLDLSPAMAVEFVARDRGPAVAADATALPVRTGVADTVLMMWMLYHVPDINQTLLEARRIARPGAPVVAATNNDRISPALDQLYRDAVGTGAGRPVDRWHPALSFNAENGAAMMEAVFDDVEARRWTTRYAVDDPAPIVDFLLSLKEPVEEELGETLDWAVAATEAERLVAEEIRRSGVFTFERHGAVFLARPT